MSARPSNQLFDAYFTRRDMREVFSDRGRVQGMLDFEAGLARAEAAVGVIPAEAVAPIEAACDASLYDFEALGEASASPNRTRAPNASSIWAPPARM
jgi:3-carboxy-cis,cis-muconate cycloisomerase